MPDAARSETVHMWMGVWSGMRSHKRFKELTAKSDPRKINNNRFFLVNPATLGVYIYHPNSREDN